jgi:hypothetical protein
MPVLLGVEWWPEPMEQPGDRTTLQEYDVDLDVLTRWRQARDAYLAARAPLIRQLERQGFRAPPRPRGGGYIDIVFDGPPGPDAPRFVEIEDDQRRSIQYGQWIQRERWRLRTSDCPLS